MNTYFIKGTRVNENGFVNTIGFRNKNLKDLFTFLKSYLEYNVENQFDLVLSKIENEIEVNLFPITYVNKFIIVRVFGVEFYGDIKEHGELEIYCGNKSWYISDNGLNIFTYEVDGSMISHNLITKSLELNDISSPDIDCSIPTLWNSPKRKVQSFQYFNEIAYPIN